MEHKNASIGKRHAPTNWRVLNISELSTLIVGADDVEKTAYIVDDGTGEPTTYVLTNYDPPTWKPTVSGTGGGGSAGIDFSSYEEITALDNDDYMLINRGGSLKKIKVSNARDYFDPLSDAVMVGDDFVVANGQYVVVP